MHMTLLRDFALHPYPLTLYLYIFISHLVIPVISTTHYILKKLVYIKCYRLVSQCFISSMMESPVVLLTSVAKT